MGDLLIYLTFGPLMVFGTYFALTGSYMLMIDIAIISIPVGFLVVGILHANNTRDIKFDVESNIRTFASTIGFKASQNYYYFLVFGSYAAVVLFIALSILPLWSLLVFLSTPIAMKNVNVMAAGNPNDPKTIAMLDVMTAQLHLVFGVLLSISLLIEALI
jgi:1,4-dihydroxy-2-naphthoate octaprenyltransferase